METSQASSFIKKARRQKSAANQHCPLHQQGTKPLQAQHPDYSATLPRLRRASGQIQGIERMIQDGRYCVDILNQLRAVKAAIQGIEATIFEKHLRSCVANTLASKDQKSADRKIQEIMDLFLKQ